MVKISYVSLIYKSTRWLRFTYDQFMKHTKMGPDDEFYFLANDAIPQVINYLQEHKIKHYIHNNTEEQRKEWYINNVYRAWNQAAKHAKNEYIIFLNSDFAYTPNWNVPLIENINDSVCICSRLVERGILKSGQYGIEKNFGNDYNDYNEANFIKYVDTIKEKTLKVGGLFMPLLVKKQHLEMVNYYPEGNVKIENNKISLCKNPKIAKKGENIIPGDLYLMYKLRAIGVTHMTAFNSIIYHFQQGEMMEPEEVINPISNVGNSNKKIILVNDYLFGLMGEKVLWNFLLEHIPNLIPVDKKIIETDNIINSTNSPFEDKVKSYINKYHKDFDFIIQNGSWFNLINMGKPIAILIQDNLRKMGTTNKFQETNFKKAEYVIVNSNEVKEYYSERNTISIPLGVDNTLFKPYSDSVINNFRHQLNIPNDKYKKIGIFVGACNEVNGWKRIKNIIDDNQDILWLIVSKHKEKIAAGNIMFFSQIKQLDLSILYNIADFFIIGSKSETQCLAAIESCFCNTPIIMRNTGFVSNLNSIEKEEIGIINDDFENAVNQMKLLSKFSFNPKNIVEKYFSIQKMIKDWKSFIETL
jgi:glycosyltransferase involved in cell wall biosynthesis